MIREIKFPQGYPFPQGPGNWFRSTRYVRGPGIPDWRVRPIRTESLRSTGYHGEQLFRLESAPNSTGIAPLNWLSLSNRVQVGESAQLGRDRSAQLVTMVKVQVCVRLESAPNSDGIDPLNWLPWRDSADSKLESAPNSGRNRSAQLVTWRATGIAGWRVRPARAESLRSTR